MKKPKLSNNLVEELKSQSSKDKKRRIIANVVVISVIVVFVVLAKLYVFKGNIKINDESTKAPGEKIQNQPEVKDDSKAETKTPVPAAPATATPAPAPKTTTTPSETMYVIKEGDTLSGIANANGMTSKQLMDYNGIVDPASITPGQSIKIPN